MLLDNVFNMSCMVLHIGINAVWNGLRFIDRIVEGDEGF